MAEMLTVHCFWGWCDAAMTGTETHELHQRMEEHYDQEHRQELDDICGVKTRGPDGPLLCNKPKGHDA